MKSDPTYKYLGLLFVVISSILLLGLVSPVFTHSVTTNSPYISENYTVYFFPNLFATVFTFLTLLFSLTVFLPRILALIGLILAFVSSVLVLLSVATLLGFILALIMILGVIFELTFTYRT